ncbi:MAG: hypothetical protein V1874_09290 [Spirochaetota bacterium]
MKTRRNSIHMLLNYGWSDISIAKYLMIKPNIVKYYRFKFGIIKNEYQGFY